MPSRSLVFCMFLAVVLTAAPVLAQGPAESAPSSAPAASSVAPAPNPLLAPTATAPATPTDNKPARGDALRERGGRRGRAGSTASGVLFLVVLVGAMGYYVVKKLRR